MISFKKILRKILGCCYTTGSSGDWTWKKYADGTFELYGYFTRKQNLKSGSGGTYYNANENTRINLPIDFNITSCVVQASPKPSLSSGVFIYEAMRRSDSPKGIDISFRSHQSITDAVCSAYVFCVGTWE